MKSWVLVCFLAFSAFSSNRSLAEDFVKFDARIDWQVAVFEWMKHWEGEMVGSYENPAILTIRFKHGDKYEKYQVKFEIHAVPYPQTEDAYLITVVRSILSDEKVIPEKTKLKVELLTKNGTVEFKFKDIGVFGMRNFRWKISGAAPAEQAEGIEASSNFVPTSLIIN